MSSTSNLSAMETRHHRWPLAGLTCAAALWLSSCALKPFTTAETSSEAPTVPAADETKKETATPEPTVAPDPLAADEFKKISKNEARIVLAYRQAGQTKGSTFTGKDGATFSTDELRRLGSLSISAARRQSIVSRMLAFKQKCAASNTEFILHIVPAKTTIFSDYLPPADGDKPLKDARADVALRELYADLVASGLTVLDQTETLHDERQAAWSLASAVWTPEGSQIAAKKLAKLVNKGPWRKDYPRDEGIITNKGQVNWSGTSLPALIPARVGDDGTTAPLSNTPENAPVLLIGDSTALTWQTPGQPAGFTGASPVGLGAQLSAALALPVAVLGRRDLNWENAAALPTPIKPDVVKCMILSLSATQFLDPSVVLAPEVTPPSVKPTVSEPASAATKPRPRPRPRPVRPESLPSRADDPPPVVRPETKPTQSKPKLQLIEPKLEF